MSVDQSIRRLDAAVGNLIEQIRRAVDSTTTIKYEVIPQLRNEADTTRAAIESFRTAWRQLPKVALLRGLYHRYLIELIDEAKDDRHPGKAAAFLNGKELFDFDGDEWTSESVKVVLTVAHDDRDFA